MASNPVFDLNEDIDLELSFLRGMLSDAPPSLAPERDAVPAVVVAGSVHTEMMDCEPTEDDGKICDGEVETRTPIYSLISNCR